MRISVPIYRLKRLAKAHARRMRIPLSSALDDIAKQEGFQSWSHLSAKHRKQSPAARLLKTFQFGDTVNLGARPNHGKTAFGLELLIEALRQNRKSYFFSLYEIEHTIIERLYDNGANAALLQNGFVINTSDQICADYIMDKADEAPKGSVILIDYLQILDQKRDNPPLQQQLDALKVWATNRGLIIIFTSQIDRRFAKSGRMVPVLEDVHLPNPLDLSLFTRSCFLHQGEIRYQAQSRGLSDKR